MYKASVILPVLVLGSFFVANPSCAEDCSAVLVKTDFSQQTSESSELAMLNLVTKENFSQFKAGGGASLTLPISGIPIGGSANFDEFRENLDKEENLSKLQINSQDASSIALSTLSPALADDWLKCMQSNNVPLILQPVSISDTSVLVGVHWKPLPIYIASPTVKIDTIGGKPASSIPTFFSGPKELQWNFSRVADKPFRVTVTMQDSISESLFVPQKQYANSCTQSFSGGSYSEGSGVQFLCEGLPKNARVIVTYTGTAKFIGGPGNPGDGRIGLLLTVGDSSSTTTQKRKIYEMFSAHLENTNVSDNLVTTVVGGPTVLGVQNLSSGYSDHQHPPIGLDLNVSLKVAGP